MHYSVKHTPLAAAMIIALNAPLYSPPLMAAPGDAVGGEFLVNTYTTNIQQHPRIAMDADGDFVVTWASYGPGGDQADVYGQRYNADGTTAGAEFQVNTYTTREQTGSSIAMDADGDFVITWASYGQDGDRYGIYAQRFNTDGTTAGSEFQVSTFTSADQTKPSTAMDADGDFVITWQSKGQDGDLSGIYAQRYNADGTTAGSEFQVNTYTTRDQSFPHAAMDADGDFAITWSSFIQAPNDNYWGVYAQRYNADGTLAGNEFHVNTFTSSGQNASKIAMDADGDFVITWASYSQDSDNNGIYAQRFNADGTTAGSEFQVSTFTTSSQNQPSIAMDADGDFAVSWESLNQDGSSYGVYAQRYIADGTTTGGEFQVSTFTTKSQNRSDIAMDADGDFTIAWHSYRQDGDSFGVYAQRYIGNQTPSNVDLNLIVQDDTDPVVEGNNFVYSLITTNNGSGIAMDVNLSTDLPTDLVYLSDDSASLGWSCTEQAATLNCNKPFMTPAEMNTINVTVTATAEGTLSNTVTASAGQVDANAADNTDTETTEVEAKVVAPSDDDDGVLGIGSMQGVFSLLIALPLWLRRRFRA